MADIGRGPFTLDELIAERQKGYTQGYDDARRETALEILERCETHEYEPFPAFVMWVRERFGLEDGDA